MKLAIGKATISLTLLSASMGISADEVVYSGSINIPDLTPEINLPDTILAGVAEYELLAKAQHPLCSFTGDSEIAMNSFIKGQARCLFEWGDIGNGIAVEGLTAEGVFAAGGTVTLPYTISAYTGSSKALTQVYTGEVVLQVTEPDTPAITTVRGAWDHEEKEGFEQINYNATAGLNRVDVSVTPQPYEQIVTTTSGECIVPADQSGCSIIVDMPPLGDELNLTGEEVIPLSVNSVTRYFTEQANNLTARWDYRPPELVAFDYHVGSNIAEQKEVDVNGTLITIAKDEAIVAMRSPHFGMVESDFWNLKDARIRIQTEEGFEHQLYADVGDERIRFDIPYLRAGNEYFVDPTSTEVVGDVILYRYSLSEVPDGKYEVTLDIRDYYGNGKPVAYADNTFDRFPPAIEFLFGGRKTSRITELYFTDDLGAVAFSGWNDGSKITSFNLGGVELPTSGEQDNIRFVTENIGSQLNRGETYEVIVTAEDATGNKSSKSIELVYNPATFTLDGVPEVMHQNVEAGSFKVNQRDGRCTRATSTEMASLITAVNRKACVIQWNQIPAGMEEVFYGVTSVLTGAPATLGENTVSFDVMYHNVTGEVLRVADGVKTFNVVPASDIELNLDSRNLLSENVVGAEYGRSLLSRYTMNVSPGAVKLRSDFGADGAFEEREYNQLQRSENYTLNGVINDYAGIDRPIFDRYQVTTTANYMLAPERKTTKVYDVIRLPDERITANISYSGDVVLSTENVALKANIGRFERASNGYVYDASTMGEWTVYPALQTEAGIMKLAEPVKVDAAGEAMFDVSAKTLFDVSSKVYLVANIESPHPEYAREMKSRATYVEVLKGTSVEGGLETRVRTGRVPFSTSVRFDYNTREDQLASSGIQWEVSDDGVTWTPVEDKRDSTLIYFTLREPTEKYVRVKTENISTGDVSYSDTIKLISYRQARLQINAPRHIYPGQEVTFNLADYYEPIDNSWGDTQWSFDGGETWVDGDVNQVHTFASAERHLVKARFKYIDAVDVNNEKAWSEATFYANVVEPRPVVTRINAPMIAEAGVPMDVTSLTYNPHSGIELPIISEWTLPDGTTRTADAFQYTFTAEELLDTDQLEFKLTSWVEGYRAQTEASATKTVRGWGYDFESLPINLTLNTNILVAPSNIYAAVSMPYIFAPGVEFTYEWIIDESMARVEYTNNRSALIVAQQPGMHTVKVIVRDNRGGVKELTKFIDVVEAEQMQGSITLYSSNRYNRAPVMISATSRANPGHPRDYANTYKWSVNGVVQPEFTQSMLRYEALNPGTYNIEVEVTSNYGQVERFSESLTVIPNELPTCQPNMTVTDTTVTLTPTCLDPDGRIIAYRWFWNGQEQGPYGSQIRFNKTLDPSLKVEFIAVDDSGGETKGNFEW
jgi:hypothetical protein